VFLIVEACVGRYAWKKLEDVELESESKQGIMFLTERKFVSTRME
jgi:hypothetical protein